MAGIRAVCAAALAVLAITGAIVAIRAWLGPFFLGPVSVNSPMNVEGVFALVFIGLVLCGRAIGGGGRPLEGRPWLHVAGLLVMIAALFWRSLFFPLLSDDYILVMQAGRSDDSLLRPFFEAGGDGSYRPVGHALLFASGQWAHSIAVRWHILSLALHTANTLLVWAAARYAVRRADVALLAATIFALHGTRPEAVTWTAGRWDVFAAFFALGGLLVFLRYYDTGKSVFCAASVLLVAAAIMCKESAYAFPALAVAFVAVARFDGRVSPSRRVLTTLIAPAIMLVYRFILFRGPGGYIDPQTGRAQILSVRFLPALKALFLRLWAVLIFPIDWAQAPELYLAAVMLLMIACLAGLSIARSSLDRKSRWILAACVMGSTLPAVHLLAVGSDLLGSRILYLPVVVFALFLSVLVMSVRSAALARPMAVCVIVFYAATLGHNLDVWGRVASLAERTCIAAAQQVAGAPSAAVIGIPVAIDGVPFFANGLAECVALHSSAAPSQWIVTHLPGKDVPDKSGQRVLVWDTAGNFLR